MNICNRIICNINTMNAQEASMKLFNTLTREKEEFIPLVEGEVKIYTCGPTVYNYFHVGNARPFITFDTLRKYLEYKGYKVTYVQNFTDIDDKMINQANAEEITVRQLADKFINEYYHDADRLNITRSTYQPRATDCIGDIVDMIAILVEKGNAYVSEDGVYFSVESFENYGKLSNFNLEELEENASDRLCFVESKRKKADFALWKFKKEGEPSWPSPWGEGRPGWHIECSAMSRKYLGESIDIHCGGQDLVFPHHENEIAQSEAVSGKPFVKYWIHNGFININNNKMSKSANNFFTIRDITKKYEYDVVRFFILSSHYRSPINFSDELLEASTNALERIRNCVENVNFIVDKGGNAIDRFVLNDAIPNSGTSSDSKQQGGLYSANAAPLDSVSDADACIDLGISINENSKAFMDAMDDDLNTADAISKIFDLVRDVNISIKNNTASKECLLKARELIVSLCGILGIKMQRELVIPAEISQLAEKRTEAKKNKDFKLADELRSRIGELGFEISDTPSGPKITKK
jgi:cysteinyl-tRNA synthetase